MRAYIYLSSPRKAICGMVDFDVPIIDTPERIAALSEQQQPGSRQGMLDYLYGRARGYAIPILACREITPIPYALLKAEYDFSAPQHYLMLDHFQRLRDYLLKS